MQNLQKKLTRALAVGLVLIMGFVLAGCEGIAAGKLNIDLTFDKEGRLTGTYKLVVDTALIEEKLSASGSSLNKAEVSKQLDRLVDDLETDAPEGMTVEKIDTESEAGLNITLDKVPSGKFDVDGLDGADALVEVNSDFVSVGVANPVQPEALLNHGLPADPSEVLTEAKMTLTLPGNIEYATGGEVNGNTVTYDLLTYDDFAIAVTAPLYAGPLPATGIPWMFMVILIGGTVLPIIIGVVIVVIVVKRQKKQRLAPASPGVSMAYPQQGQQSADPGQVPHGGQNPPQGHPGQQPPHGSGQAPTQPPQNPPQGSGPTPPNPPQR